MSLTKLDRLESKKAMRKHLMTVHSKMTKQIINLSCDIVELEKHNRRSRA